MEPKTVDYIQVNNTSAITDAIPIHENRVKDNTPARIVELDTAEDSIVNQ